MEKHDRTHRAAFGLNGQRTNVLTSGLHLRPAFVKTPSERGSLRSIYLAGSSPIFVAPANDGRVNFACLVQL